MKLELEMNSNSIINLTMKRNKCMHKKSMAPQREPYYKYIN